MLFQLMYWLWWDWKIHIVKFDSCNFTLCRNIVTDKGLVAIMGKFFPCYLSRNIITKVIEFWLVSTADQLRYKCV